MCIAARGKRHFEADRPKMVRISSQDVGLLPGRPRNSDSRRRPGRSKLESIELARTAGHLGVS